MNKVRKGCSLNIPIILLPRCTEGVPVKVLMNMDSVGRQLTPLSATGRYEHTMAKSINYKKVGAL